MRMDFARGRQRRRPVAHVLALVLALVASGASAVEPGDPAPAFAVPAIDGGADIDTFRFAGKRLSTTNLAETVSGIIPLDAVTAVLHAGSALADCRSLLPISSA